MGLGLKGKQLYSKLYEEITEVIREEDIEGVQIYPAAWPRKVMITVREKELKERLLIEGMALFGAHIDLRDENSTITRVTVQDAPVEWDDSVIGHKLADFGTVVRVEREHIYHENRRTPWTTGTRYVYFSPLMDHIPQKVALEHNGQKVTLSVWYRDRLTPGVHCGKCGSSDHNTQKCPSEKKVCYRCGGNDHLQSDCPLNDGTKRSDKVVVFLSEKSYFSNFNMDCPIEIDGYEYLCNEQYIQSQKALICGDEYTAHEIMKMSDPRQMKRAGNRVRNYDDRKWKENCDEVVMTCVRKKFKTHEKAAEALLETGERLIGEATTSLKWGIGLHIRERAVLDTDLWSGKNTMGQMLMKMRAELQKESPDDNTEAEKESSDSDVVEEMEVPDDQVVIPPTDDARDAEKQPDGEVLSPGRLTDQIDKLLEERKDHGSVQVDREKAQHVEYGVLIGDSNVRDLRFPPDLPLKVISVCTGGTTVQEIDERIKEVQVKEEDIKVVALHVGTCNFPGKGDGPTKAKDLYRDYVEAVNSVCARFKHADLLLSETPLRNQMDSKMNEEIKHFNKMLKEMCEKEANVIYVGHDNLLKHDLPCPDYYRTNDKSGVHLNEQGRNIVCKNLTQGMIQAHYQNMLKDEWYVYNG